MEKREAARSSGSRSQGNITRVRKVLGTPVHREPSETYNTFHSKKKQFGRSKCKSAMSGQSITSHSSSEPNGYPSHYARQDHQSAVVTGELSHKPNHEQSGTKPCDPLLSYVTSARQKLGLNVVPDRYPLAAERESLVATSGPIAGIRDLKVLSRRLQSTLTHYDSDSGGFVYCLRRRFSDAKTRYNPYDLSIVTSEKARVQSTYWTASAFNVSKVGQGESMEVTPVLRWLWEREIFYHLLDIPFFNKFRVLKAFAVWKKWVCRKKSVVCRSTLQRNLFSADALLQRAILQIYHLCEIACPSDSKHTYDGVTHQGTISLLEVDTSVTYSLQDFVVLQEGALVRAEERLGRLREEIVTTILSACKMVAESEGIVGLTETVEEQNEPSHTRVLEWRTVHERLKRFVRLCDVMVTELLQSLVMRSLTMLEHHIRRADRGAALLVGQLLHQFHEMSEQVLSQPHTQSVAERLAFSVDDDEDGEGLLPTTSFSTFLPSVDADMAVSDGDPSTLPLMSERDNEPDRDPQNLGSFLLQGRPEPVLALWEVHIVLKKGQGSPRTAGTGDDTLQNVEASRPAFCVSLVPSLNDFESAFFQLLGKYQALVTRFKSLLDEKRLLPYISRSKYDFLMQLEESTLSPESPPCPDIHFLISEYAPYQACVGYISGALQTTMNTLEGHCNNYNCFSKMAESCSWVNIASTVGKKECGVSTFQRAFAHYHDQVHAMEGMVQSFRVGMMRVEVGRLLQECLAYPQTILSELEYQLPHQANFRSNRLATGMKVAVDKLLDTPTDVESFVHYLGHVEEVTAMIRPAERELLTLTNLYNVAQDFQVPVPEEDMAMYKTLFPQFRYLKNILLQAEVTKSESVYQFSSDLRSQVLALLHRTRELKNSVESTALLEGSMVEPPEKVLQQPSLVPRLSAKDDSDMSLSEREIDEDMPSIFQDLEEYGYQQKELLSQAKSYMEYHQRLGAIPTRKRYYSLDSHHTWTPEEVHDEILAVQQSLSVRQTLLQAKRDWGLFVKRWNGEPLSSLDVTQLQKEVNNFVRTVDYLERGLSNNKLVSSLKEEVVSFHSRLPTFHCLLNPQLKLRHWEAIEQCIGQHITWDHGSVTLVALQEMSVLEHHSLIASISEQANHEAALEKMLKKVSHEWVSKEFTLVPYQGVNGRQTHILGGVEDLLASLEDSLTTLATIKSSRHVAPIKHAVLDWEGRLSLVLETVEQWILCQRNWLYLEGIFSAVDIQRQLSTEAKLFVQADKSWREAIRILSDKPTALKAATTPGVLEAFQACSVLLEQVFKSLEDYLEAKRLTFPRLYFISNNELLDILAHIKDPSAVQPYLSKLFGNIKRLELATDVPFSPPVLAMVSAEGEQIDLPKNLFARGSPELWLANLESAMFETVGKLLKAGVGTYDSHSRKQWAIKHPGQVVLAAAEIDWTQQVEVSLHSGSPPKVQLSLLHQTWMGYLEELASLSASRCVSAMKQCVITALLTLDVHRRDVIHSLIMKGVTTERDFEWIRHLRYYWHDRNETCTAQQCFTSIPYGKEYLGCLPRLVLTPLSERCYLTLTTALHLHLGGSPIGPAGTGKSETVKDLAKALGRLCLVFNCSEGLDYKMMGRFFSGLCQSGVWCCFDEFNRINVEVLSVVAQQLHSIKTAKDSNATRFIFEHREVNLVPNCAAFITMNPGYAGRVELPDNLKSLFRPVAMIVPDTAMIAEVLLFTCGFTTAPVLAVKLSKLHELAEVQLSKQVHYDFGLRTVKTTVTLAGEYLQKERCVATQSDVGGDLERSVLLQAVNNSILPKLVAEDVHIMKILLQQFFAGCTEGRKDEDITVLKEYLEVAAVESSLQCCQNQIHKCLQLYSTILIRHGAMLVGPTGGGKSTVVKLLQLALNKAHGDYYGQKAEGVGTSLLGASLSMAGSFSGLWKISTAHCQVQNINPKCLSLGELYGCYNPVSLEWKNGVLAKVLQTYSCHTEATMQAKGNRATYKHSHDTVVDIRDITSESASASVNSEMLLVKDETGSSGQSTVNESHLKKDHTLEGSSSSTLEEIAAEENIDSSCGLAYPSCAPVGWKWVVLDGPVDPGWVENLNSTLDDSMLLCLANGERIELHDGMRILFETDELSNASPASISRCGMIFVDPSDLGWKPYVLSWIKTLPQNLPDAGKEYLLSLFEQSIDEGMKFLRRHASSLLCPLPGSSAIATLCHILAALLEYISINCGGFSPLHSNLEGAISGIISVGDISMPMRDNMARSETQGVRKEKPFLHRHPECLNELLGKLFVFAFTWAIGGSFKTAGDEENIMSSQEVTRGGTATTAKFDALVHRLFTSSSSTLVKLPPSADLIYSYYVDISSCSFVPWKKLVPSSKEMVTRASIIQKGLHSIQSMSSSFIDMSSTIGKVQMGAEVSLVPTVDTIRLSFLACLLQGCNHPVLLCGKLGVGKTLLLTYLAKLLQSVDPQDNVIASILGGSSPPKEQDPPSIIHSLHVSSLTLPSYLQSTIENHLVRKSKASFGAPEGTKVVVCLDDLNVAPLDSYGSQSCAELLRQLVDDGGWYDRKNLAWKEISGVTLLATAGERGWGYNEMNQRCLSKFSLFCLPEPSSSTLTHIFSTHMSKSFTSHKLSSEATDSILHLVACAVHVYHEIRAHLLPSPVKPQYIFCTRDLTKAFTGLLRVKHKGVKTRDDAIHLLCHELVRVFQDRCLHPLDKERVLEILTEALKMNCKVTWPPSQLKEQLQLYEEFTDPGSGYSPVKNTKRLVKHLERTQSQYNIAEDMNSQLVFFPLACEHVVRVMRVLQQPGGHLLLVSGSCAQVQVGMGGVGRHSCVRLASYITGYKYYQLTSPYKSSGSEYQDEIKHILLECGVKDHHCVLLVTETLGEQHSLFHDLHELLVCGDVAGLFEREELDAITTELLNGCEWSRSQDDLWGKFVQRVRHNLHIVLCFTPSSQLLSGLCRKYPGLITHTTVTVFEEWPAKAMYGVAVKELHTHEVAKGKLGGMVKDTQTQVAMAAVKIHGSVVSASQKAKKELGHSYPVTPSSFIHFIHTFCTTLQLQHERITSNCSHLENGLHHLSEADKRVVGLKDELEQLKPEIEDKAKEVESLLQQLSLEQGEVDTLRTTVEEERRDIAQETEHVAKLAEEAEADLRAVLPALEEAERGLNSLKKADLLEIRSYQTPPSMVTHVMSAVCVLLHQSCDWNSVKHLMADPMAFLKRLTSFDKDNIPDRILSRLKRYTRDPNFNPDNVAHYSVACQSFCQWVLAIGHYGQVIKVVHPKRLLHQELGIKLQAVRGKLEEKEAQLKELESKLSVLQEQYSITVSERNTLQEKCEEITVKLTRAEDLTNSLRDEQVRWQETLAKLQAQTTTLVGDALLSAACLVYMGPFTPSHRQSLLAKWKHVCQEGKLQVDSSFSMERSQIESDQAQQWFAQGLPKDVHSVQNAIVITQCVKWPLVIDPQDQGTRWLKAMLKESGLIVVSYHSSLLVKTLNKGVRAGLPVMIEDIPEQLSSLLEPFLIRNTVSNLGQLRLKVGKTEIEYNPSFRLFLICKQPNPQLSSELCINTTLVNFSATFEGLQSQLLSNIINLEEPTLESQYSQLLLSISADRRQLKALEHRLLDMLRNISGSILDDQELVLALQEAKQVETEVEARLARAQQTQDDVSAARRQYQPVATRGAVLYFSLLSLKHLSPMYQFSLMWFQGIFSACIQDVTSSITGDENANDSKFQQYIADIIQHLTKRVFDITSMALSSDHHLPFSFKFCSSILMQGDEIRGIESTISKAEWLALTENGTSLAPDVIRHRGQVLVPPTPPSTGSPVHSRRGTSGSHRKYTVSDKHNKPGFLSQDVWSASLRLANQLPCFIGLSAHLTNNGELWKAFINSAQPWEFEFTSDVMNELTKQPDARKPSKFNFSTLSHFQKLMLIKTFCPQHLTASVRWFIQLELGSEFIIKPPLHLGNVFKETNRFTPVLFILGPGTDPTSSLSQLSEQLLPDPFLLESISLGQGQGERARELIQSETQRESWVLLQNCHLAESWMPDLEDLLRSLQDTNIHPNFRLWLSSKPTPAFPPKILQSSIKVSLECPKSLKANLQQLIHNHGTPVIRRDIFEDEECGPLWRQLLYGLCLFHATANGRGKYGSCGWNTPYDFSSVDLQVTVQLLQSLLSDSPPSSFPWEAVHHITGEICYGGRVTDQRDLICMKALLRKFCSQEKCYVQGSKSIKPTTSYDECCSIIEGLSMMDSPEAFGLHQSHIAHLNAAESKLLQFLLHSMEFPTESHIITFRSHDELVLEKAQNLLEQLPTSVELPDIWSSPSSPALSPFSVLLASEVSQWNHILQVVSTSLSQLIAAVKGETAMLESTKEIYHTLAADAVPTKWLRWSESATSATSIVRQLGKWFRQFLEHLTFVSKWASLNLVANSEHILPPRIHLGALNSPKGLFVAVAQDFCCRSGAALENVELRFQVGPSEATWKVADNAVILSGLHLEGAQWSSERGVVEQGDFTERYCTMPDVLCCAVEGDRAEDGSKEDLCYYYSCPLYATVARKCYTVSIPLWTTVQPDHWTRRGVALFAQID